MGRKILLAACIGLATSAAVAQEWPTRPIEMILPFAAGGGVDSVGRAVAASMSEQLGKQVVVVNRLGAGGTLGFANLAAAAPDGYTLGFGPTTPIANAPYLVKGVRYNVESFDYICQVFENPFSIAVRKDAPYKSLADLIAAAKQTPNKLTYGHAGLGSIPHLSVENASSALGFQTVQVPFRGDADLLPVLLKGDLDFGAPAISSIVGQDLRVLVVFSDKRHPAFPDAPTAKEVGIATSVPPGQNGVYAPKGLPEPIRQRLEKACEKAVDSPAVHKVAGGIGAIVQFVPGQAFHDATAADYKFKGELIRRLNLGEP